jgi:cytochrome c553
MKLTVSFFTIILFLFLAGSVKAQVKEHPGQKVFMDAKCQTCHTVESHNITSKSKKAVDLSNVGAIYRANFLEKFLMKQEKINDKVHPQVFKGSNEDLNLMAEFLQTLNTGEKTDKKTDAKDQDSKTKKDTTGTRK